MEGAPLRGKRWLYDGLFAAVVVAGLVVTFGHEALWPHVRMEREGLHAAMEAASAVLAALMAVFLWFRRREERFAPYWILAVGFSSIAVHDAFTAMAFTDGQFRFFHAASEMAGAMWFLLVLVPALRRPTSTRKPWPLWVALANIVVGGATHVLDSAVPGLLQSETTGAVLFGAKLVSTGLYAVVGIHYLRTFHRSGRTEDAIFAAFMIMLTMSQVTGTVAETWYDEWWIWHGIRLLAFGNVLAFLIMASQRSLRELGEAVQRHEEVEARLRESEQMYRMLAENAGDVIWTRDLDLSLTYVSPSIEKITGRTAQEEMEASLDELATSRSIEAVTQALAEEMERETEDGADPERTRTMELQMLRKDGSTYWSEMTLKFLRDEEGNPKGILGVTRDVTERKKQQVERRRLQDELVQAQRMEGIGRLAGGIAHDFNNLLAVIINYSDFLLEALPDTDVRSGDVQEIRKAAERGANLTRQLLDFSRKQTVSMKVVDMVEVVRDMEEILRRTLGEDVELRLRTGGGRLTVKADPGRIQQVLMNLVVNARDAMPQGGLLTVEAAGEEMGEDELERHASMQPGRYVCLRVSDTGQGMDERVASQAFEPFFTTKDKSKGTGLGLSTVYGIVKQAGGSVALESELDEGTTVYVWLPRSEEAVPESRRVSSPPDPGEKKRTVLVVEDERAVLGLIVRILERKGYHVLAAGGGEEALALSEKHPGKISLILTDVIMPGMSGREVAEEFARDHPDTPVLFMSGYTDDVIGDQGILDEGVAFIHKPFSAPDLLKKIHEVMEQGPELGRNGVAHRT